jgi:hypothetical protein
MYDKGGLTKWFSEKWVDIWSEKNKVKSHARCGRKLKACSRDTRSGTTSKSTKMQVTKIIIAVKLRIKSKW